jgi:hypothetical protein
LCLEPLLEAIRNLGDIGAGAALSGSAVVVFNDQAYADDLAFISNNRNGIESMLHTLGFFEEWSMMEVNPVQLSHN